jgi:hypothetical protein
MLGNGDMLEERCTSRSSEFEVRVCKGATGVVCRSHVRYLGRFFMLSNEMGFCIFAIWIAGPRLVL